MDILDLMLCIDSSILNASNFPYKLFNKLTIYENRSFALQKVR